MDFIDNLDGLDMNNETFLKQYEGFIYIICLIVFINDKGNEI